MTSDKALGMWHSSRVDNNGHGLRLLTDMSAYRHRDVRNGQLSHQRRAQDVQQHFVISEQRLHITTDQLTQNTLFWSQQQNFQEENRQLQLSHKERQKNQLLKN